jgi:hypothetical protein
MADFIRDVCIGGDYGNAQIAQRPGATRSRTMMWQVNRETELRFPSPVRVDELCGCSLFPLDQNQPETGRFRTMHDPASCCRKVVGL